MPHFAEPPPHTSAPSPRRVNWTRANCDSMAEAGILTRAYELIDGEILTKAASPGHAVSVSLLHGLLAARFGGLCVQCRAPIDLGRASDDYNEPEPDVVVTAAHTTSYPDRHPGPDDPLLVVEVADTTVAFDRTRKAALYARAGIRDYWVVDIAGRQVFVHRAPAEGGYGEVVAYAENETIAPLATESASVRVGDFLPPIGESA